MIKKLKYLSIVFLANILFLFAPKKECEDIPKKDCPHSLIEINKSISFLMSWDGFIFIDCAIHPSKIVDQNHERQSRPLFIIISAATGYSLYYLSSPIHSWLEKRIHTTASGQFTGADKKAALKIGIFLLGFVLINSFILLASILLFEKIIAVLTNKWKNGNFLLFLLFFTLVGNQETKIFFWTAHQQMFAVLTPLLCLYTSIQISNKEYTVNKILTITFLSGFLFLVYGSFLLLLPSILFSLLYLRKKNIFLYLIAAILFFLPFFSWVLWLKSSGTNFYSAEVGRYRQFVWMTDSLRPPLSSFISALWENTVRFILTWGSLIPFIILILLQWMASRYAERKNSFTDKTFDQADKKSILLITGLLILVFFWLLGYYADRLSFSLAPILLILFAVSVNQKKISPFHQYGYSAFLITTYLYIFFFDAPHFSADYYH